MIVVVDSGSLLHLAAIGQLELVHRLSPDVLVAQAVFDEVVVEGAGLPGAAEVGSLGILIAAKVRGDVPALAPHLFALRASGLWLSDGLIARVLSSVGESARG